jgi:hypothetical protein
MPPLLIVSGLRYMSRSEGKSKSAIRSKSRRIAREWDFLLPPPERS